MVHFKALITTELDLTLIGNPILEVEHTDHRAIKAIKQCCDTSICPSVRLPACLFYAPAQN